MENNNDFVHKFNYSKKADHKNIYTTIVASFLSAILGGACALGIYIGINKDDTTTPEAVASSTTNSSQFSNLNLEQVSLTNYSDTAIYAANKVLPSMVSISVEYDVTYMGRTRNK